MAQAPALTRRAVLAGLGATLLGVTAADSALASPRDGALIVVDVQVDFCEGGSLAVTGGAEVARSVSRYLAERGDRYRLVVATRDWHIDPGDHFSTTPDFVDSWPVHCRAGTPGARFHPDLNRHVDFRRTVDVVVSKGEYAAAYSGFEGRDSRGRELAQILKAKGITRLDVVGIATDYCVRATVLDALAAGFAVRLLTAMTAGVAPESTRDAVQEMRRAGARIVAAR